ncbi:MAG: flippase-like domain-containing protein, partial [Gammaproteobacteria bacterium]|nr:flippase-like domain-containing protein [Gammaproteobacteria bacterium]
MKSHHLILGLVIAGLALFLTFRNVSFHEIYPSIRGLEVQYLPLAVVLFFASFAVRVYRWHYLCRAVKV